MRKKQEGKSVEGQRVIISAKRYKKPFTFTDKEVNDAIKETIKEAARLKKEKYFCTPFLPKKFKKTALLSETWEVWCELLIFLKYKLWEHSEEKLIDASAKERTIFELKFEGKSELVFLIKQEWVAKALGMPAKTNHAISYVSDVWNLHSDIVKKINFLK